MGNRGCLHDAAETIVRRYSGKRWIICVTHVEGRRRRLMTPGQCTELFFLDEATALAAGHRPCAACRFRRFSEFSRAWGAAHACAAPVRAGDIDSVLHTERLGKRPRMERDDAMALPVGAMLALDGNAYVVTSDGLRRWSPEGYVDHLPWSQATRPTLLTPPATIAAIRRGYVPVVHTSVND